MTAESGSSSLAEASQVVSSSSDEDDDVAPHTFRFAFRVSESVLNRYTNQPLSLEKSPGRHKKSSTQSG